MSGFVCDGATGVKGGVMAVTAGIFSDPLRAGQTQVPVTRHGDAGGAFEFGRGPGAVDGVAGLFRFVAEAPIVAGIAMHRVGFVRPFHSGDRCVPWWSDTR